MNAQAQPKTQPPEREPSVWNLPNALGAIRFFGSFFMVWLALAERPIPFIVLFVFLLMTDWFDGKIAIALKQQTSLGARIDSLADATLYSALLFGAVWLRWPQLKVEAVWVLVAITSYGVTSLFGVLKFKRWPSYHTLAAKTSWYLASLAGILLFANSSVWMLRIAAVCVTLTNLEAILITSVLPEWRTDVLSLYHVIARLRSTNKTAP